MPEIKMNQYMNKIKLICFVCISLLFFGTSVQANLRSNQNDFTTKELVFQRGFNFDSEVEIIQTGYPSPEPPPPEPPSPDSPLPMT